MTDEMSQLQEDTRHIGGGALAVLAKEKKNAVRREILVDTRRRCRRQSWIEVV